MKVVPLISGGINSTVLMYRELAKGSRISPLFINYGQRSIVGESKSAYYAHAKLFSKSDPKAQERIGGVKPLDLSNISHLVPWDKMLNSNEKMPIPFLNALIIDVAFGYAKAIGAEQVVVGNNHDSGEFIEEIAKDIDKDIKLRSPFSKMSKHEIIQMGKTLGVGMDKTFSCYRSMKYSCGLCYGCLQRKEAFKASGIKDETIYTDDPRAKKGCCG